jgi:hypothetical protein
VGEGAVPGRGQAVTPGEGGEFLRLLQRQILNTVGKVFEVGRLGDQFQIVYTSPNGDTPLMGIDDAGEWNTASLTTSGFRKEIFVLRKQDTPQFCRTIQQNVIRDIAPAILLSRQNIHASQAQTSRDRSMNVLVHIQRHTHGRRS